MTVDLIISNAKQLLTLQGKKQARSGSDMNELGIIENGALAIKDGLVVDVGITSRIQAAYSGLDTIDASGMVIIPGFVDPHTHPVYKDSRENEFEMRVMGRSYVEISQSGGGIRSSVAGVRNASEQELYDLAEKRIWNIIRQGTTTLEAKSGYGLSTESELKMLRVIKKLNENLPIDIVPTFLGAHEFPEEYKDNKDEYIRILQEEMIPAVAEEKLAEYCDIFTEKHVFSVSQSRKILKTARRFGLKIRMHADEIEPIGGAELAAEIESFVNQISGEIEATWAEIEAFGPTVLGELQAIKPELVSVQTELNAQIQGIEAEIEEFST